MRFIYILLWLFMSIGNRQVFAQRFIAEKGSISFHSKAAIEDIYSENKKVNSLFNIVTGNIAFSIPVQEFQFEKRLMKEHFNDKYMESHKFPSATFQGIVTGYNSDKKGKQNVYASGKLTIHGTPQDVYIPGTLEFIDGRIVLLAKFHITLSEFGVIIPRLLWQNISEKVEVIVDLTYKPQ